MPKRNFIYVQLPSAIYNIIIVATPAKANKFKRLIYALRVLNARILLLVT